MLMSVIIVLVLIFAFRTYLRMTKQVCDPNVSMVGRVVIVTGANSGIGFQTAKDLARRGARVILGCRSVDRGTKARDEIISVTNNKNVVFKQIDLSSLRSVREFAKDIIETENELHVLINNAGMFSNKKSYTEDGIDMVMQVNYFGPFLLTRLLLPLLKKSQPSRIVNVSSIFNLFGTINFRDDNHKSFYNGILTYCNSKLCNLIFTIELSERLRGTGVVVNAVHPGIILTNITNGCSNLLYRVGFAVLCWFNNLTDEDGAQTPLHLATSDIGGNATGKFFINCSESSLVSPKTRNEVLRKKLWEHSNKLIRFDESSVQL